MNLYKIWQTVNDDYDTYDSAVVAADSEQEAILMHPDGTSEVNKKRFTNDDYSGWCESKDVQVSKIGTANNGFVKGVIVASFNAG